ncbi:hypothetical protein [Bradyrhizobium cosmicum]|uniref:hypothetical protein n=1 Tax=Bradyrhizobium cosmicum TaxID=1404864 RepID=UPI00143DB786|nr:hypothetical protein [Bradyrhizobium cosmicum]
MENLEEFVHRENLRIFRRQLELAKDDVRRQWLTKRLAEEEAKGSVATGLATSVQSS